LGLIPLGKNHLQIMIRHFFLKKRKKKKKRTCFWGFRQPLNLPVVEPAMAFSSVFSVSFWITQI